MKRTIYAYSVIVFIAILLLYGCNNPNEPDAKIVAAPSFNPPGGGTYTTVQNVTISCATEGATIFYSIDGSTPSIPYNGPVNIAATATLKAKASKSGWTDSQITSATYTISAPPPPGHMIYVPGGTFTMGDTRGQGYEGELPTHTVILNPFYIGTYEVTQAEYCQYMQPGSSWTSDYGLGDNYPAYYVSWYAVLKYCNLRSMAEGLTPCYTINGSTDPANWGAVHTSGYATWWDAAICDWNANGYRLPTEAEWEYAARGATNNPDYLYSGSDDINAMAWYESNSVGTSHPVGTKAPNGIGAYDMSGNLFEWCWDWCGSYSSSPQNNPTGPASGSFRLLRGGDWCCDSDYCRVSIRVLNYPFYIFNCYGFRLCRSAN